MQRKFFMLFNFRPSDSSDNFFVALVGGRTISLPQCELCNIPTYGCFDVSEGCVRLVCQCLVTTTEIFLSLVQKDTCIWMVMQGAHSGGQVKRVRIAAPTIAAVNSWLLHQNKLA